MRVSVFSIWTHERIITFDQYRFMTALLLISKKIKKSKASVIWTDQRPIRVHFKT